MARGASTQSPSKRLALTSGVLGLPEGGGGSTRSLKGLALTPDVVGPEGGIDSVPAGGGWRSLTPSVLGPFPPKRLALTPGALGSGGGDPRRRG